MLWNPGALVDASGNVIHNEYAGFLLRAKFANIDEGDVASGFATS
jgi:glutathione synthase